MAEGGEEPGRERRGGGRGGRGSGQGGRGPMGLQGRRCQSRDVEGVQTQQTHPGWISESSPVQSSARLIEFAPCEVRVVEACTSVGHFATLSSAKVDQVEGCDLTIHRDLNECSGWLNCQVKGCNSEKLAYSAGAVGIFLNYMHLHIDMLIFVDNVNSDFCVAPLYEPYLETFTAILSCSYISKQRSEFKQIFSDVGMYANNNIQLKQIIGKVFELSRNQKRPRKATRSTGSALVAAKDIPMTGTGAKRAREL